MIRRRLWGLAWVMNANAKKFTQNSEKVTYSEWDTRMITLIFNFVLSFHL